MMHNMSHHFKASNTPHNPQPFKLWINLQVISPILLLTKHPQLSPAIYNSISQEKNHKKKILKCIFIDTLNTKHKCFPCVFKLHRTDYRKIEVTRGVVAGYLCSCQAVRREGAEWLPVPSEGAQAAAVMALVLLAHGQGRAIGGKSSPHKKGWIKVKTSLSPQTKNYETADDVL